MNISLRTAEGTQTAATLASLDPQSEPRWMILAPHDDDAVLGCGILISMARRAGISVAIAVLTDGRLGFSQPEDASGIVQQRRLEMQACAQALDVEEVHFLDFPDGELLGEMRAGLAPDDSLVGMLPALCELYRAFRPTSIFAPTPTDLHPDHQAVSAAADIVGFHASAGIWLNLGQPGGATAAFRLCRLLPLCRQPRCARGRGCAASGNETCRDRGFCQSTGYHCWIGR